uniref:Uncharacterized protein n=1 Tax=Anguilla anguilla TaxID=7936 RepID=A0A0E9V335_ANGAN
MVRYSFLMRDDFFVDKTGFIMRKIILFKNKHSIVLRN